jgi:hypothetical protein
MRSPPSALLRSPPSALLRSPPSALLRRPFVIRVIAVAIVVVLGIAAFALSRLRLPANPPAAPADLAAPLSADTEADLAAAMPAIDEIRQRNGSLLDGTLLQEDPTAQAPTDNSYVELLRREARRLESHAADLESSLWFDEADGVREEAQRLWMQARENSPSRQRYSATSIR